MTAEGHRAPVGTEAEQAELAELLFQVIALFYVTQQDSRALPSSVPSPPSHDTANQSTFLLSDAGCMAKIDFALERYAEILMASVLWCWATDGSYLVLVAC